jgi:hypothetical protein
MNFELGEVQAARRSGVRSSPKVAQERAAVIQLYLFCILF